MTAAINPATHFIAPDADGDLTLWRGTREDPAPVAVLRECDTDPAVWAMVVAAVSTPDRLTDEERLALLCDCGGVTPPDPHGPICATRGGFSVFVDPDDLVETVEHILAARLAAQPPATDRDALDALACEDCSGPAPSKEVDPRDPLGIVTPNPKPTCPVPGFGRNHLWMTGAFYVGSRLIQSDDYMICGYCGQIEYDAPEEPTRPAPDTLADHVQALANLQMQYDASQEALGEVMTENRENREAAEHAQAKWDAIDPYADDAADLLDVCARAAFMRDDLAGHVRGPWTYDTIPAEGRREFRATAVAVLNAARAEAERHVALLAGRPDASPEGGA
jgi:hypothetical protein